MISRKRTFFLGIFIFLIPYLGFPSFWKTFFVSLSGIALITFSVKFSVPKKAIKPRIKKEKVTPVFVENIPMYDRRATNMGGVERRKSAPKVSNEIEIE